MSQYRNLSAEELAALRMFADAHGRKWRETLTDTYWYNARLWYGPTGYNELVGSLLHGLRNDLGPKWLHQFKFPEVKP